METASPAPQRRTHPFRAVQTVLGIAILLATLFTALPSRGLVAGDFYERLSMILTPHSVESAAADTRSRNCALALSPDIPATTRARSVWMGMAT